MSQTAATARNRKPPAWHGMALALRLEGNTEREIAAKLYRSPSSVHWAIGRELDRLGMVLEQRISYVLWPAREAKAVRIR